jgi:Prokaryotic membrane lipoprotein lipid attachment site
MRKSIIVLVAMLPLAACWILCVAKYNSGGHRGLKETVAVWSPAI